MGSPGSFSEHRGHSLPRMVLCKMVQGKIGLNTFTNVHTCLSVFYLFKASHRHKNVGRSNASTVFA